eukprot:TRINITY_DN11959_c0_g1_i1.p3 TRINITY_DN11959_c0_g1~~TRINITY_DN11959_c0_g1_i1.p3  ORF type:complete len:160 (-),score=48.22 TRINITY_DN11959_c0_g1_i1:102-581(-)
MVDQLRQDEIMEFSEAFSMYDDEGEGFIPVDRLGDVLKTLGLEPHPTMVEMLVSEKREEGEERLDFMEFLHLMATHKTGAKLASRQDRARMKELKKAFAAFDTKCTGVVATEEVKKALTSSGMGIAEIERFVQRADPQGTGKIDYKAFVSGIGSATDED